jgi:hypothetical protein
MSIGRVQEHTSNDNIATFMTHMARVHLWREFTCRAGLQARNRDALPRDWIPPGVRLSAGLFRLELQRNAIHAVAHSGGAGTVGEHMTEMASTACTVDFSSVHEQAPVDFGFNGRFERAREAWPTGSALEFRIRHKERLPASGTFERTLSLLGVQRTRTGRLGPVLPQHFKLLRRQ